MQFISLIQNAMQAGREKSPFVIINRAVYFNGKCEECRPHCAAVCCSGYGFVGLTESEVKSGKYLYRQMEEGCSCSVCQRMKELGLRHSLRKNPDGSCVYLDGTRKCSIYADRPEVCKGYTCVKVPFVLSPA
jgi:Fe-S-cluster containining protein